MQIFSYNTVLCYILYPLSHLIHNTHYGKQLHKSFLFMIFSSGPQSSSKFLDHWICTYLRTRPVFSFQTNEKAGNIEIDQSQTWTMFSCRGLLVSNDNNGCNNNLSVTLCERDWYNFSFNGSINYKASLLYFYGEF